MFEKECVPYAPTLIESMRSIGYSFPSAIADLLDNSVSVHAKHIDILTHPSSDPFLVILDDGDGMTKEKLYEAMRYGSSNPLAERATDDLGRFGLGLKAASLSQCRRLVVVSKCNNEINACAWDLDYVIQKGVWALQCFDEKELVNYPFIDRLRASQQGTYIYLSNFDRIREGTNDLSRTFAQCLDDMGKHLSLVFHRFLEEGLSIRVNDLLLEAKDPFLKNHRATQKKRESSFRIYGEKIVLQPYILPHASKLSQEDLDKVDYFQKSTGIFNKNGKISAEELERMKVRAQTGEKNLWHGFISVDEENSHKIDSPEKCIHLIKRTFDSFFRDMGFDPKNIDLICALHLDRPKHLHIHFEFWGKEPKQKYRKKQTEYRHKGKIPQEVIDKMHERLNLFLADEHIYHSRDEALRQLKELSITHGFERFCEKEARREIMELAKDLPVGAKIFYGHKDMEPFRPRIDKIVNLLL